MLQSKRSFLKHRVLWNKIFSKHHVQLFQLTVPNTIKSILIQEYKHKSTWAPHESYFCWKQKVHLIRDLNPSNIDPICWKNNLKLVKNINSANSHLWQSYARSETFTTIANSWNLLAIVIKSSILDIGRFSESITGRKLNTGLDLKLKFTILFITYLKSRGQHQTLQKIGTDYKLRNLLQFYPSFLL